MGVARTLAVALNGVDGQVVEIEADLSSGLPGLYFTGRADRSVVESRDRIRSAVLNSGIEWPNRRITLALLPADVPKIGSRFDFALALAVLGSAGLVDRTRIADAVWLAELGLEGKLRPIRGVLPAVLAARRAGVTRIIVSRANGAEAALVDGLDVRVADTLGEVVAWLVGDGPSPCRAEPGEPAPIPSGPDLADVQGQVVVKRGLEVAAAGGHHLYLVGAPGAGKTMLAERLPGLLPDLDDASALEVTGVHSVAGALSSTSGLVRRPPFQAPHHTASVAALVGGGSGLARPGAISLAHHGVLFLDEAPEFSVRAVDALRQPLESGEVSLARAFGTVRYPARFQLVLAANPCPCGRRARDCTCAPQVRRRYEQRLSGPLLDRVDLRLDVDPVSHADLFGTHDPAEPTAVVAARVREARLAAAERWGPRGWQVNADVPGQALREPPWRLAREATKAAESHVDRGQLSARGFDRVLRMAWTLSDLSGRASPGAGDLAESLFLREGRGSGWAA
jgi:magnesium chelatase family protein